MRRLFIAALLLAPISLASFGASAADRCKYEAPRNLQFDLSGVRGVQIDIHSYSLHLNGSAGATSGTLTGRACASDSSTLANLQVTQRREGDQLLIDVGGDNRFSFHLFGDSYADLDVNLSLPSNLPVSLNVGSGDAEATGVAQLHSNVGSGDLHVRQVPGSVQVSVGSGDVEATDIGSLDLGSVGSGDFKAHGIKGDAKVGSIGSGDVTLHDVGGSVHADTLGSGDLSVNDVGGDLSLGAKGSGDVDHSGVKGKINLPKDDD
ncbi:MAG TPA: DUF4097 family beta strand repeat-containing protein [Rhodanobacter sp.]